MKPIRNILAVLTLIVLTGLAPTALLVTQTGCKTAPSTVAYQSLGALGASVDTAMQAAAAAKKAGKLSDDQWAKVVVVHGKYLPAYNLAVQTAATATDTGLSMPASANILALAGDVLNLLTAFGIAPK